MCPASCVGKAHRCYPILTTHAQIQSQHPLGSGRSNGVLGWREEPIAVVRLTEGGFLGQWPQVPLYKRSSAMCSWMLCSLTQESVQRWCIQGRRKKQPQDWRSKCLRARSGAAGYRRALSAPSGKEGTV